MRILWSTVSLLVVGLSALLLWNAATVMPPSAPVSGVTVENDSARTGSATATPSPSASSTDGVTADPSIGVRATQSPLDERSPAGVEAEAEEPQFVAPVPVTLSPDDPATNDPAPDDPATDDVQELDDNGGNSGRGGGSDSDDDPREPGNFKD